MRFLRSSKISKKAVINKKTKFSLILTVLIASVLMFSDVTSADLYVEVSAKDNNMKATTLQMSTLETSNENNLQSLFQIIGLVPGGFGVKTVRIKKDGIQNFNYQLKSIKVNGDDGLYNGLNLKIMQKDKFIFQGKLSELNQGKTIDSNGKDDWIFFISLDKDVPQSLNKSCEFVFYFKTYRNNLDETGGLKDEIKLSNFISSTG